MHSFFFVLFVASVFAEDNRLEDRPLRMSKKSGVKPYIIWAVGATEVEVDVLTGEKLVIGFSFSYVSHKSRFYAGFFTQSVEREHF